MLQNSYNKTLMSFNAVILLDDFFHTFKSSQWYWPGCMHPMEKNKGLIQSMPTLFLSKWCWRKTQTDIFRPCSLISLNKRALPKPTTLLCDIMGRADMPTQTGASRGCFRVLISCQIVNNLIIKCAAITDTARRIKN